MKESNIDKALTALSENVKITLKENQVNLLPIINCQL